MKRWVFFCCVCGVKLLWREFLWTLSRPKDQIFVSPRKQVLQGQLNLLKHSAASVIKKSCKDCYGAKWNFIRHTTASCLSVVPEVQFKTCDMWSEMENLMEPAAEVQAHIFHAVQTEGIELSNEVWKLRSSASGWIWLNWSCKVTHVILKSQTDISSLLNYIVYLHMYIYIYMVYMYISIYIYIYMRNYWNYCTMFAPRPYKASEKAFMSLSLIYDDIYIYNINDIYIYIYTQWFWW